MTTLTRVSRAAHRGVLAFLLTLASGSPVVAQWSVAPDGAGLLPTDSPVITELSGVTYLGSQEGVHRFGAVQDDGSGLAIFGVGFSSNSALNAFYGPVVELPLEGGLPEDDHEGVAYTNPARNSVFVSEERTPDISEYSLVDGSRLQSVALPSVFSDLRFNRGLESLTRSPDGQTMWTANEEALLIDGPASSTAVMTTVRLLQLTDDGNSVTAGPQYAYKVNPIHAGSAGQSGLSDLVALPDGTLIALERSQANTLPVYETRIYQIDFNGATDISASEFDVGLANLPPEVNYTPVAKTLLWSGQVVSALGENLEGLALGPMQSGGGWPLLGVVDNGAGQNYVVTFELTYAACGLPGDYSCNGSVGEEDYLVWRDSFGQTGEQPADGNGDEVVDAADYTVWRDNLGAKIGDILSSPLPSSAPHVVPEPAALALLACGLLFVGYGGRLPAQRRATH